MPVGILVLHADGSGGDGYTYEEYGEYYLFILGVGSFRGRYEACADGWNTQCNLDLAADNLPFGSYPVHVTSFSLQYPTIWSVDRVRGVLSKEVFVET